MGWEWLVQDLTAIAVVPVEKRGLGEGGQVLATAGSLGNDRLAAQWEGVASEVRRLPFADASGDSAAVPLSAEQG